MVLAKTACLHCPWLCGLEANSLMNSNMQRSLLKKKFGSLILRVASGSLNTDSDSVFSILLIVLSSLSVSTSVFGGPESLIRTLDVNTSNQLLSVSQITPYYIFPGFLITYRVCGQSFPVVLNVVFLCWVRMALLLQYRPFTFPSHRGTFGAYVWKCFCNQPF